MKVGKGARVSMHYRVFDAGGELVESTEDGEPVSYRHGHEEILPGLERALEGAESGGTVRVTVDPVDAYGDYNPEGLVAVPRAEVPSEHVYVAGDWLSVSIEDEDDEELDDEREMEMRIVEVRDDEIVLDANHPLAGQRITFEVDVLSVERDRGERD